MPRIAPELQGARKPGESVLREIHQRGRADAALAPAERLGAIFYEDTGDPHPRVALCGDGAVLYMVGKNNPRVALWNGQAWSKPRKAPWKGGVIQATGDGRRIWIVGSSSRATRDEVSFAEISSCGCA